MSKKKLRGYIIEFVLLLAAGLALAMGVYRNDPSTGWVLASNVFFCTSCVFIFWGMIHLLGNMHMFTSFTWGFKSFHKLLQNKQDRAEKSKEDYLAYRSSRPHHNDVPFVLIAGAIQLGLSLACSLLAG